MLFQLFAACSCDILILFMICLGGEIIIHAYDLSNDAYHLFWYQYESRSKYMVWFLIRHTQKAYYFASFKSLNCSLETFTNVRLLFYFNSVHSKYSSSSFFEMNLLFLNWIFFFFELNLFFFIHIYFCIIIFT